MKRLSFVSLFLLLFAAVFVSCSDPSLNSYVESLKGDMPQDAGSGITMNDVSIVDDYVQIDATTDETELDLGNPLVSTLLSTVAEAFKSTFLDDADMAGFMQACANEGKGFRMIIKGTNSGSTATLFEVTPEELAEKFPPKTNE